LAGGYFGVGAVSETLKLLSGYVSPSALEDLQPLALNRFQNGAFVRTASPDIA